MMSPPFFPITPSQLRGDWRFGVLPGDAFTVEGFSRDARDVPHKGGRTVGFRVSDGHSSVAYIPDHCPTALGPGTGRARRVPRGGPRTGRATSTSSSTTPTCGPRRWRPKDPSAMRRPSTRWRWAPGRARAEWRSSTTGRSVATPRSSGRCAVRREPGARRRRRGGRRWRCDAPVSGPTPSSWAPVPTGWWPRSPGPGRPGRRRLRGGGQPAAAADGGAHASRFRHDVCSAVHPLLLASPAFRDIDLAGRGVRLLDPALAFAHPLDGGRAACVGGSVGDRGRRWKRTDGLHADLRAARPQRGQDPARLPRVMRSVPAPRRRRRLRPPGLSLGPADGPRFHTEEGRALVAGTAAHSMLPLTAPLSGVFPRLFTALAHRYGWPVVEGGSADSSTRWSRNSRRWAGGSRRAAW